ncbi:MAG: molecular chaperone HtpG [bacterium]|nr:molecular chaperone HtpG [bacterium]
MTAGIETHSFQAETKQLLDLMIRSLYTNKEIFLRELISNASDALDRLRFEALTTPELLSGDEEFEIRMSADSSARTLTIMDNGIGMSRQEVMDNIGTIAKSGSRELMEKLKESKSAEQVHELIGQFGVGFYSAFMAADKVTLVTRRAGEETAIRWESKGDGEYTLVEAERPGRGTTITLHLKPVDTDAGLEDFTDQWVISRIVKRYSDFVTYPIINKEQREEPEKDEQGEPAKDGKTVTVVEDKTLNSMKPIWTRPEDEVKDDEYAEFYKHISHDWTPPMKHLGFKAEGRIEYQALLFLPAQAPYDLYYLAYEFGLQLYVRRVMVMDRCEDLLPRYLRFVKGLVDSADLPLNISRQRLQEDRHITQIRKWLTKKILEVLSQMQSEEEEQYLTFWEHFGKSIKEGLSADFDNKDKLLALTLFASSHDPEKLTTLDGYVERMKEDQEQIYYIIGESRSMAENSPHLETFKEKGYEVLYLIDPVDELMIQHLMDYKDKKLKSVGKGTIELGSKEEKEQESKAIKEREEELKDLLELLQKRLDDEIKWVRLSTRLTTSPACLVGAEHDYSPQLEKLLQKGKGGGPKQRRILELNPKHEILLKMEERFRKDKDDPILGDFGELLMGYAMLAEGSEIPDTVRFNQLLTEVLVARMDSRDQERPAVKKAEPEKPAAKKPEAKKAEAKKPEAKKAEAEKSEAEAEGEKKEQKGD